MNSYLSLGRPRRLGRSFGLSLGIGLALLANLGDRAFSASAANSGIDPLEVLDLQIRNNAIVLLDSSGSMRDTADFSGFSATSFNGGETAGDDPQSKMFSAKQAIKKIIGDNQTKVSFQFGRYQQAAGGFGTPTFLYSCNTVATAPEVACTSAADATAFIGGFTRNAADDRTVGANTTYALYNTAYRVNRLYRLKSDGTACGSNSDTAITTGAWAPPPTPTNWNLPNVPAGTNPNGPPFIDVQRYTNTNCTTPATPVTTRFYLRGAQWSKGNTIATACGGFQSLQPMADCTVNAQLALISPFVGPEIVPTTVSGDSLANLTSGATANAIRASGTTPLAESLIDLRTIFQTDGDGTPGSPTVNPLWTAISTQTPLKQRTFVIILTDGDDSCTNETTFENDPPNAWTLRAAHKAQQLYAGIAGSGPAGTVDPASRVKTFVVAYGGAVTTITNTIAWGGTGMVRTGGQLSTLAGNTNAATNVRWADTLPTAAERAACTTCVDAFPANDLDGLTAALQAAIDLGSGVGEYSDQQSVTETVFEFAGSPMTQARYDATVPVLLQSTFELPEYKGHLNAFMRGAGATSVQKYDAGQRLQDRLEDTATGMGLATSLYRFGQLHNDAGNTTLTGVTAGTSLRSNGMKIKRRIFTTTRNGVNPNYTPANLLAANFGTLAGCAAPGTNCFRTVPLWPPTTGTANNAFVAPNPSADLGIKGILDTAMGFDAWTTVAQVQAAVPGACQASPSGGAAPADCTSGTAGVALAKAKREAREIILANIAGARVYMSSGLPVRTPSSSGPAADRSQLQYAVRPWVLAESTLAAPGIVTPPLFAGPLTGDLGAAEYKHYRDGLKASNGTPLNNVMNGLGLRNPDKAGTGASQTSLDAVVDLKPVMSVVYHATNQGLHAFRAGPCPTGSAAAGIGPGSLACTGSPGGPEIGGEELWAYVPFDLLGKLPALNKAQSRTNKQYLLASPVRFADVFVRGAATLPAGATVTGSIDGVWRTILYFGRGQGGKYLSAVDVTTPGPFTRHSLDTEPPVVVWNRGNPDTATGVTTGAGGVISRTALDYAMYLKMGETWSVPSLGYVRAADYPTSTKPTGTDFVLFAGSGYSDVAGEGKTFFILDALTGDRVREYDIADGSPAALPLPTPLPSPAPPTVLSNFLVASPVVYAQNPAPDANYKLASPSGFQFIGNAASIKAKYVYFGDLHSRIWRFDATAGATVGNTPTAIFTAPTGSDGNQPFATAVSVVQYRPNHTDLADPGRILIYAESGFDRRVPVNAAKPFKAYAFEDTGTSSATLLFNYPLRNATAYFRGTVQPAAAFTLTAGALPANPVVFYAGTKYNASSATPPCASSFDSLLIALQGVVSVPGSSPVPAFDLSTGDDAFIQITGSKINAIRVSPNEGNLVIDQGLNAQNAPPPPGVPQPPVTTSSSSSLVYTGLTPGTLPHKELSATNVNYRVGSSVCRTEY